MNDEVIVSTSPQQLISQAIDKSLSIEHLERLMGLQERWQANQARIAFFDAMSQFQNDCPVLEKKKRVNYTTRSGSTTDYKYAPLGEIAATIKDALQKNGLSFRWEMEDKTDLIHCTCIVSHKDGHSERSTMSARKDESGNKNEIQARGSTITYLQRYTLIASLGISTADEDTDAQAIPKRYEQEPSANRVDVQSSENKTVSFAEFDPKIEKMQFGKKFNGQEWWLVEKGYLEWMVKDCKDETNRKKAELTLKYLESMNKQDETKDDLAEVFDKKEGEPLAAPLIDVILASLDEVTLKRDNEELTKWWATNYSQIQTMGEQDKKIVTKAFNNAKIKEKK